MAIQKYLQLNGKKYAVMHDGWEPNYGRQRSYNVGLTGKTIIQDFTVLTRTPLTLRYRLKVYINDPWPDTTWGDWADLQAAFALATCTLIEHDDSITYSVGFDQDALVPIPRVPAAAISGTANEVYYVDVNLVRIHA